MTVSTSDGSGDFYGEIARHDAAITRIKRRERLMYITIIVAAMLACFLGVIL
ncbi:MAG: hypothetical protein GY820_39400 [Gammaproteobacteria bacterium]|nr:hypothetical protein [Gammaproteobacteria bacterium]